jgi:hypothetical protein
MTANFKRPHYERLAGTLPTLKSSAGMSDRSEEYRRKAEQARVEAAKAGDPSSKAAWLKLAEDWLRLAEDVAGGRWSAEGPARTPERGD